MSECRVFAGSLLLCSAHIDERRGMAHLWLSGSLFAQLSKCQSPGKERGDEAPFTTALCLMPAFFNLRLSVSHPSSVCGEQC